MEMTFTPLRFVVRNESGELEDATAYYDRKRIEAFRKRDEHHAKLISDMEEKVKRGEATENELGALKLAIKVEINTYY